MKDINKCFRSEHHKKFSSVTSWRWTTTDDEKMWAYMAKGMDLDDRCPPNLLWGHLPRLAPCWWWLWGRLGGSLPIILSWQVTMSIHMVPHTSWTIQLTNRVDTPTTWVGTCSTISYGVWGNCLPCRVLAISMNPGGGTHSQAMVPSGGLSTLGLEVANGLWGVATGFGCPTPLTVLNTPHIWAFWFLLWLPFQGMETWWNLFSMLSLSSWMGQLHWKPGLYTWWGAPWPPWVLESILPAGTSPSVGGLAFSAQYCGVLWHMPKSSGADKFYNPAY